MNFAASGLNRRRSPSSRRRRRRGARCYFFPCKIQNSKFGRGCGQILNFEFCGVGSQSSSVASPSSRRVSIVGSQSSVAVVASPPLSFSRKNQNSKFGRGCGQILNFDFCGVGSQSSSVVVVAVVAARAAATFLAKFKIQNLAADAAKF